MNDQFIVTRKQMCFLYIWILLLLFAISFDIRTTIRENDKDIRIQLDWIQEIVGSQRLSQEQILKLEHPNL